MAQITLKANINECTVEGWQSNTGEVNARVMSVEMSEDLLTCDKQFVTFDLADGTKYESLVVDGKAKIPIFEKSQFVKIGLYAENVDGNECEKRYSAHPDNVYVSVGSFGNADKQPKPTPGDYSDLLEKIEDIKNSGGGDSGDGFEILGEVKPTEEHTNEQVYGAKALDEVLLSLEETIEADIQKGLIKETVRPNIWELESGIYFVRGGFYFGTPMRPPNTNRIDVTECFMFISENETQAYRKDYYAIVGNDIYFGYSVLDGINAETGEEIASGEYNWCHKTELINERSSDTQYPTAKAVYDFVNNVIEGIENSQGIDISGATVGQTVKISEVDADGKPTAWEPVDFPVGGGAEEWEPILAKTGNSASGFVNICNFEGANFGNNKPRVTIPTSGTVKVVFNLPVKFKKIFVFLDSTSTPICTSGNVRLSWDMADSNWHHFTEVDGGSAWRGASWHAEFRKACVIHWYNSAGFKNVNRNYGTQLFDGTNRLTLSVVSADATFNDLNLEIWGVRA